MEEARGKIDQAIVSCINAWGDCSIRAMASEPGVLEFVHRGVDLWTQLYATAGKREIDCNRLGA